MTMTTRTVADSYDIRCSHNRRWGYLTEKMLFYFVIKHCSLYACVGIGGGWWADAKVCAAPLHVSQYVSTNMSRTAEWIRRNFSIFHTFAFGSPSTQLFFSPSQTENRNPNIFPLRAKVLFFSTPYELYFNFIAPIVHLVNRHTSVRVLGCHTDFLFGGMIFLNLFPHVWVWISISSSYNNHNT